MIAKARGIIFECEHLAPIALTNLIQHTIGVEPDIQLFECKIAVKHLRWRSHATSSEQCRLQDISGCKGRLQSLRKVTFQKWLLRSRCTAKTNAHCAVYAVCIKP